MDENNDAQVEIPHNPYAPEPGAEVPNQYGQYADGRTEAEIRGQTESAGAEGSGSTTGDFGGGSGEFEREGGFAGGADFRRRDGGGGSYNTNLQNGQDYDVNAGAAGQNYGAGQEFMQNQNLGQDFAQNSGQNLMQNQNPNFPQNPQAFQNPQNLQNPQPFPTQPLSATDTAGTLPNHLNVKVLAPTHFDNMRVVDPRAAARAAAEAQARAQSQASSAKLLSVVIMSVVALVCLVFGIIATFMMITKNDELVAAQAELAGKTAIIEAFEAQSGREIASVADVPSVVPMDGYVYIQGWKIKLKIPQGLTDVSYILNQNYRQTICFNARTEGEAAPAFADVRQNPGGMGCLMRVAADEGEVDAGTGVKFGEKVYAADGYNYFYVAPTGSFSTDAAETEAVKLIREMVEGENISSY